MFYTADLHIIPFVEIVAYTTSPISILSSFDSFRELTEENPGPALALIRFYSSLHCFALTSLLLPVCYPYRYLRSSLPLCHNLFFQVCSRSQCSILPHSHPHPIHLPWAWAGSDLSLTILNFTQFYQIQNPMSYQCFSDHQDRAPDMCGSLYVNTRMYGTNVLVTSWS